MKPEDVTACLVTRGDQPEMMDTIFHSLIFPTVRVWNNLHAEDWKCAGRYMAMLHVSTRYVYFQDDDVLVPPDTQRALLAEYRGEPCLATWGHGETPDGYDDLPLVGAGAIVKKTKAWEALMRYARYYPLDEEFAYEADFVVGVLYEDFRQVHLPFHINLEIAQAPERLCNQSWQRDLKLEITNRARAIRDEALVAA